MRGPVRSPQAKTIRCSGHSECFCESAAHKSENMGPKSSRWSELPPLSLSPPSLSLSLSLSLSGVLLACFDRVGFPRACYTGTQDFHCLCSCSATVATHGAPVTTDTWHSQCTLKKYTSKDSSWQGEARRKRHKAGAERRVRTYPSTKALPQHHALAASTALEGGPGMGVCRHPRGTKQIRRPCILLCMYPGAVLQLSIGNNNNNHYKN